jgi:hypothetical protein
MSSGTQPSRALLIAALAAIVCGTLVWRGRLVPLALAAGLDVGFGIGLPRGGSAFGAMLRILPADDAQTAETLIFVAAVTMFVAAILCVLAVPSALKLRQWARDELASEGMVHDPGLPTLLPPPVARPRPRASAWGSTARIRPAACATRCAASRPCAFCRRKSFTRRRAANR